MQFVITEDDYREALGDAEIKRLTATEKETILGPDRAVSIIDALPRVLADRVRKIIPDDYQVLEIEIKVALSGTPFGVGVSGDATVKYGPKPSSN